MALTIGFLTSPQQYREARALRTHLGSSPALMMRLWRVDEPQGGWFSRAQRNFERICGLLLLRALFLAPNKALEIVLGTISNPWLARIFQNPEKFTHVYVVDDGVSSITYAKIASSRTGGFPSNVTFYSKYIDLMPQHTPNIDSRPVTPRQSRLGDPEILCVIGSPLVEHGIVSRSTYLQMIADAVEAAGARTIVYLPHRSEHLDPISLPAPVTRIAGQSSIQTLHDLEYFPGWFWSCYSSALVDVFLEFSPSPETMLFTTFPEATDLDEPIAKAQGVLTSQTVYETYRKLGFCELPHR